MNNESSLGEMSNLTQR